MRPKGGRTEDMAKFCIHHGTYACTMTHGENTDGIKRYSKEPCRKCGERKVVVDDVDVAGGIDYVISCEACGDHYRVDGPDS